MLVIERWFCLQAPGRKRSPGLTTLYVLARSAAAAEGHLHFGAGSQRCALGAAGCRTRKREGDRATPIGRWRVRELFYRADRLPRPRTQLPARPLRPADGWCDAVGDRNYNRPVRHPYPASAEKLWRSDSLYDLIVVLDHNMRPRVQGHGSAVFLHVAGPNLAATAGCIALPRQQLLRLIGRLRRGSSLAVHARKQKKRPE